MPKYRKLVLKTTESLTVNEMPDDFHRFLWLMLPLIVCRDGRGLDNAAWVKAKALPLRMDVTPNDVQNAMDWFWEAGIITKYAANGYGYFFITNWHKYQGDTTKEAESIYPDPADGQLQTSSGASQELVESESVPMQCNAIQSNTMQEQGAKPAPTPSQFQIMRDYWIQLFPDKPKPRSTKTVNGKIKTRMSEPHFRDNWRAAMLRASKSNYVGLKETTWFDFGWLLENDSNYEKALNGKYDVKPGTRTGKQQPPPRKAKAANGVDPDKFWGSGGE